MALRVWLPLNGNLENQGLNSSLFTSSATYDNNGKIGKCLSSNIALSVQDNLISKITLNNQYSFALWMKSKNSSGWVFRFGDINGNTPSNSRGMWINIDGNYEFAYQGSGANINLASTICDNNWHHIVYTVNDKSAIIYIDGKFVKNLNLAYNQQLNYEYIQLNGNISYINDFRIYDHCLSPKEVKELSKGLCLHYKLDGVCNTIDNTEWDCSGFGNNGTKNGSITTSNDTVRYSSSYKFDTTSSKIKLPAFSYSGLANSYSFSWWQKNTGSGNMPWGFSDGNRLNLYHTTNLCWNTGDGGSNPFKDSSGTAIPNTRLCDSVWHHCVVTGNGSTTKLYIDGIYAGAATTYKAITGTQIYISGWDTSTSYTFSGSNLSDFRIYATVLSDVDIKELYNTPLSIDNVGNMYTYEFKEIE